MWTATFEVFEAKRKILYYNLLTSGKLNGYIAEIDKQSEDMFYRLVKELAEKENVTEKFKSTDQMLWTQKMNNIRNRATDIVNHDIKFITNRSTAAGNLFSLPSFFLPQTYFTSILHRFAYGFYY